MIYLKFLKTGMILWLGMVFPGFMDKSTAEVFGTEKEVSLPDADKVKILVFTKTNGYRHKSIPRGIEALDELGSKNKWEFYFTEDSTHFTTENLKKYNTIVFLNTSGDILGDPGKAAFKNYIHCGGGFVGIHAASNTEEKWDFYTEMVGAKFRNHPRIQPAKLNVNKQISHPAIAHLGAAFERTDEWYNFIEPVRRHVNVLIDIDESSYEGDRMGQYHPVSWYHYYEGGRIFYTAMGHTEASYSDPLFMEHVEEGIRWAVNQSQVTANNDWVTLLDDDLTHWDIWLGAVHSSVELEGYEKSEDVKTGKPVGLNDDPKKVFSVIEEEGEKVLKITGEIYGGLTSKEEYGNYHFKIQFKWGEKKWEPRLKDKRDSGLLYHCKGPHGAFWNVWKACLEFQVQEGDCGDFIALGDVYGDVPSDRKVYDNGKPYFVFNPEAKPVPLKWDKGYESGQATKSVMNEKPNGEWNTLEIFTIGDRSIHLVNGTLVNAVQNARYDIDGATIPVTRGQLQIQSEAAEVYYKDIRIRSIADFPKTYKKALGWE